MHIEPVSCNSVMIRYEARIDETILDRVQQDYLRLKEIEGFREVVPSYTSIWIEFDTARFSLESVRQKITAILSPLKSKRTVAHFDLHEIPVDYSQGIDLERIAKFAQCSVEEVIRWHTERTYRVYAIGFMEGFAYLGTVDSRIAIPRLATPRTKVPKGAVAIANAQTAIYPQESAGGWNIVGVTDFDDFKLFKVGDKIRFIAVRSEE